MDLIPDREERAVIETIRRQAEDDIEMVGELGEPRPSPNGDPLIGHGWLELGLPEDEGGLDLMGSAFVVRETERRLGSTTIIPTFVALGAAQDAGNDALAGQILDGSTRCGWVTSGLDEPARVHADDNLPSLGLRIGRQGLEVLTITPGCTTYDSIEGPGRLRDVEVTDVWAIGGEAEVRSLLRMWTLFGAAGAGICEATTQRSVDYAKIRTQFGRAIGSFQAVAHRCADMELRAQTLWRQTCVAALSFREGLPTAGLEAASARILAARYAVQNASNGVQNHGGVGFTMELPEHRFVRRAQLLAHLGGGTSTAVEALLGHRAVAGDHDTSAVGQPHSEAGH